MSEGVEPLLSLTKVSRRYVSSVETVWAARDVDLDARAGSFVCIYGSSGSGKSTLLNLIAGLDLPDSGEVQISGQDVSTMNEDARAELRLNSVGVVFQDDALISEFTAVENVALPLEARGERTTDALRDASNLLDRVGLADYDHRFPAQLSGGQRGSSQMRV